MKSSWRKVILGMMLTGVVLAGTERPAHADGEDAALQAAGFSLLSGVTIPLNLGFSVYDGYQFIRDQRSGNAYAIFEIVVMSGQSIGWAAWSADNDIKDSRGSMIGMSAWSGLLAVHGIYTLIRNLTAPTEKPPRKITFTPALVSDGKEVTPSLSVMGRF